MTARALLLALALIGAFLLCGCEPARLAGVSIVPIYPLPGELVKFRPPEYDDFGVPVRASDDPLAGPVAWVWPNGIVNLCGARISTFYPAKASTPKAHFEWRLNFAALTLEGVHAGWSVEDTAFFVNDWSSRLLPGFGPADLPAPQIKGARFRLDAVSTYPAAADSVLEGWGELYVQLGAERDTLRTWVRVVHERFGR